MLEEHIVPTWKVDLRDRPVSRDGRRSCAQKEDDIAALGVSCI
jgi:hypothetical protein